MGRRKQRNRRRQAVIRRRNLWLANPRCHWCGTPTFLPETPGPHSTIERKATLDHLFSRFHPQPARKLARRTVLACESCNAQRARRENLVFRDFVWTLEVLGRRGLNNRQKVKAFVEALALMLGGKIAVMPTDADGQILALNYIDAGIAP
jgi:hypothetical protein